MSKGYNPDVKNADLEMPGGIDYISFGKTTGMCYDAINADNPDDVLRYLQTKLTYPPHVDDLSDCEDRAFWGVAHVRCMFPGQPVAVAIGYTKEKPPLAHAVIVFWGKNNGEYVHKFYDPEGNVGRPTKVKGLLEDFDTKVIVPFPVHRPNEGFCRQKELPPFDTDFEWASGALALDRTYKLIDANMRKKIMTFLGNKEYEKCPERDTEAFKAHWIDSIEDRVNWVFVHARRKFMGYAIGMAFGTLVKDNSDQAMLVFWETNKKPVLVDIDFGVVEQKDFKVRTLIV